MKIKKIFNQNAVLVDNDGQEKVAIGKGVGFDKKRNDLIFHREIERMFVMEPESQMKLQSLLNQIDEKFLFAAENIRNGIVIRNKLLREIEALYHEEFSIAQWAVDYLNHTLAIPYTYDEAGYIAIHIHSGHSGQTSNHRSIREVTIVSEIIQLIEKELRIDIHSEQMALNYSRLANHLRLLIQRYHNQQYAVLDEEIIEIVKRKYSGSYAVAKKIRVLLTKQYQMSITSEELGYLVIHIERLLGTTE